MCNCQFSNCTGCGGSCGTKSNISGTTTSGLSAAETARLLKEAYDKYMTLPAYADYLRANGNTEDASKVDQIMKQHKTDRELEKVTNTAVGGFLNNVLGIFSGADDKPKTAADIWKDNSISWDATPEEFKALYDTNFAYTPKNSKNLVYWGIGLAAILGIILFFAIKSN